MAETVWPTAEHPGVATIRPTPYGTFGIYWSDFEAMERRGGYSGPYATIEEARAGAQAWADSWEVPIRIDVISEGEARALDGNR